MEAEQRQSRKWLLTINNPYKHGYDRNTVTTYLNMLAFDYCCMCDEISESGTLHTHIFIHSSSPIRFARLKKLFTVAHIEVARGTVQENRNYITKAGKWEADKKAETNQKETFWESGIMPTEKISANSRNEKLYEMITSGMSTFEIIESDKSFLYKTKQIEEIRQMYLQNKYSEINRTVEVVYLYGETGTGKTYSIQSKHGSKSVCRITSYNRSGNSVYFDAYNSEPVLVFEEFTGQVPVEEMLNFLDVYPVKLPARYADRVACYTTVYLTSNMALEDLYRDVQLLKPKTWEAFLRRITKVYEYRSGGKIVEIPTKKGKRYERG